MEQSNFGSDNDIFDDDIFNNDQLFPIPEFNGRLDGIQFNNDLFDATNPVEFLAPMLDANEIPDDLLVDFENFFPELQDAQFDMGNDNVNNLNGEQPAENPAMINNLTPQQASGNQDGIMYQMCPSLSDYVSGNMSVKQQPKANNRPRYECDGSRFLPDSRYNPMAIDLPTLTLMPAEFLLKLGIVMTMVADSPNETNVHANDFVYRVKDAKRIGYACVFVPLVMSDIEKGEKRFSRASIIYKKCDEYSFDLTPFHPMTMFGTTEKFMVDDTKNIGNAAKGKIFKKEKNLSSYKIVFHLALIEDNVVYISRTTCATEVVDEQRAATSIGRRSVSGSTESVSEEDNTSDAQTVSPPKKRKPSSSVSTDSVSEKDNSLDAQIVSPPKKLKSSSSLPPMIGLPVTYVSNATDHLQNDLC